MTASPPTNETIFHAARDIPDADRRREYVREVCGGDTGRIALLEAMLRVADAPDSLLDGSAGREATFDPPTGARPGDVIGRYKLLEEIGEGGFGIVFLAEQSAPVRRKVALKVLKAGMDTRHVVARFEAERQALALMDHPNIAKVFDGGVTPAGRPYFVMELVKGTPITDFCDQNQLTPRQRLELFISVCQAVQHAHQKGIIHRDLKPSNVLVVMHDTVPVVKVIDFGVAKALGQELTEKTLFTGFAQMVGTPLYMSPEQAGQSGLDIDTRSDIYSLGVLLYELLTGTTPFDKERLRTAGYDEIRRIIREEEPPKPSTRLAQSTETLPAVSAQRQTEPAKLSRLVRGELDWVVMKCLEKDRSRRYETANSLALDVQRYLADEPVLACPPSAGYRVRKFTRRNKGPVLAASMVVLTLLAGMVGTTWEMFRADAALANAASAAEQKRQALGEKDAALAEAKDQLFQTLVHRARSQRRSGQFGQRFATLNTVREAAGLCVTPELRTEAMAALVLPGVELVQEWEAWTDDTVGMDFDAALERYVRLDRRGGITYCRRTESGEEVLARFPAQGTPAFNGPHMSPDGRYVAFCDFAVPVGKTYIWTLHGSAPAAPLILPAGWNNYAVSYRQDRRQLAIGHADGWVGIYDLDDGKPVHRFELGARPECLAFREGDGRLAVAAGDAVRLLDVDSKKELPHFKHTARAANRVCWHPDGRRLAAGCWDGKVRVWDSHTGKEVMTPGENVGGGFMAFHPDGDLLVMGGIGGEGRVWDVASGRPLLTMSGLGRRFSRDGRLLGAGWDGGSRVRVWRLADGRELRTLRRASAEGLDNFGTPVLHPDGCTLAASGISWLSFFDLVSGENLASVRLPRAYGGYTVFFDPPSNPPNSSGPDSKSDLPGAEWAGAWMTGGQGAMFTWPTWRDSARPSILRVGPVRLFMADPGGGFSSGASASRDGSVMAIPQGRSTLLLHRDRPGQRTTVGPQSDVRFSAVSPNGRWVVTGSHWWDGRSKSAQIWDAETGRNVGELPVEGSTVSKFSPDGLWLLTVTDGTRTRLWEVETWREVRRPTGCGGAFSPDSRLLAIRDTNGEVRLEETASGHEVARLAEPDQGWWVPDLFTPDGTRLIARGRGCIYVWDLRLIRRQLKDLGVDWEWPEFSPAAPDAGQRCARQVEIERGDLDKASLTPEQRARQAIDAYRRRLDSNRNDARACNNLAWVYLTAPESLRDVKAALPIAAKAVELNPSSANYVNTLGLAYYRSGRYREASDALSSNLARRGDWALAFDLYILAMTYQKLGESARARDFYRLAVRWPRTDDRLTPEHLGELDTFRAEAREVLGIAVEGGLETGPHPREITK